MTNVRCIDRTGIPFSREGMYATNNQFQKAGPKGFIQVKVLENDNLYVRVDFPGVPDNAVRYRVDSVRQKIVFFSGERPMEKDSGMREYSGTAGLGCDCCVITNVEAKMKDGILRMIVSRVKVNKDDKNKCTLTPNSLLYLYLCGVHFYVGCETGQSGRILEDYPYVVKGRKGAFFMGPTKDGGCYMLVDIPGVSSDDVEVLANESEIRFRAEVKNVYEHDDSARIYIGSINKPSYSASPSVLNHTIAWDAKFGALFILVKPPPTNNTN